MCVHLRVKDTTGSLNLIQQKSPHTQLLRPPNSFKMYGKSYKISQQITLYIYSASELTDRCEIFSVMRNIKHSVSGDQLNTHAHTRHQMYLSAAPSLDSLPLYSKYFAKHRQHAKEDTHRHPRLVRQAETPIWQIRDSLQRLYQRDGRQTCQRK